MINQEEYEILKSLDNRLRWISRDKNSDIFTFKEKPYKGIVGWLVESIWVGGSYLELDYVLEMKLFQFIQWEDEEPYRISDLIEEYEKNQAYEIIESEEAEVKKDKGWLSEQVGDLNSTDAIFSESGAKYIDTAVSIERVYDLIYQLDELEEEQLFYALIKGHELCSDLFKYWNCKAYNTGDLLVGSKYPKASCINRMTKTNWNKIGINESNADFVKAEEVE